MKDMTPFFIGLLSGLFPVKLLKYHNFNLQGENAWTRLSKSLTQPIC